MNTEPNMEMRDITVHGAMFPTLLATVGRLPYGLWPKRVSNRLADVKNESKRSVPPSIRLYSLVLYRACITIHNLYSP
jgi:hypothetical protein